jgi:hypothetical protein
MEYSIQKLFKGWWSVPDDLLRTYKVRRPPGRPKMQTLDPYSDQLVHNMKISQRTYDMIESELQFMSKGTTMDRCLRKLLKDRTLTIAHERKKADGLEQRVRQLEGTVRYYEGRAKQKKIAEVVISVPEMQTLR